MKKNITIIISILIFIIFLILYKLNCLTYIDFTIYNIIIKTKSNTMTNFMKVITFLASTKFILIVVFLLLILSIRIKKVPIIINVIIFIEVLLNNFVKIIVKRDRPKLINLVTEKSYSFPSGHTMIAVVLYGFLIYLINKSNMNKKLKIILIIFLSTLILLIMISRIYLGAHYFSDVISGLALALGYLLIVIKHIERKKII